MLVKYATGTVVRAIRHPNAAHWDVQSLQTQAQLCPQGLVSLLRRFSAIAAVMQSAIVRWCAHLGKAQPVPANDCQPTVFGRVRSCLWYVLLDGDGQCVFLAMLCGIWILPDMLSGYGMLDDLELGSHELYNFAQIAGDVQDAKGYGLGDSIEIQVTRTATGRA